MPPANWYLRSINDFDEPTRFHQDAADFHLHHAEEMLRRARPLIEEMRRGHPDKAAEFEQLINTLAARFRETGTAHRNAIEHLSAHKQWHIDSERRLRGMMSAEPPMPDSGDAASE